MSLTPGPDAPAGLRERSIHGCERAGRDPAADSHCSRPHKHGPAASRDDRWRGRARTCSLLERMEVDPRRAHDSGPAPGFTPASTHLQIAESTFTRVSLKLEPEVVAPTRTIPVTPGVSAGQLPNPDDPETPPKESASPYSIGGSPSMVAYAATSTRRRGVGGARVVLWAVRSSGDRRLALIGRDAGIEPMARAFILSGSWKPLIEVAGSAHLHRRRRAARDPRGRGAPVGLFFAPRRVRGGGGRLLPTRHRTTRPPISSFHRFAGSALISCARFTMSRKIGIFSVLLSTISCAAGCAPKVVVEGRWGGHGGRHRRRRSARSFPSTPRRCWTRVADSLARTGGSGSRMARKEVAGGES